MPIAPFRVDYERSSGRQERRQHVLQMPEEL